MKKLLSILSIVFFTLSSYGQTAKVEGTAEELKKGLAENTLVFIMPADVSKDIVEKSAQYYTDYFSVDFDESSQKAKLTFIEGQENNRRVITRFLLSSKVRTIRFEEKEYTIMEFYANFLEK
ncbi:hypothetical protein CW751_13025 [Brumimicrobium salinarum]|uniref:Uncharacterized protein n=1 Tax=Brumimicrobium salinarum TaxID=2058658 RepID=A0A2I0QZU4_9FLAO|nr:hypothetical protein [Brumimicrobium salinarum]PKR79871.1 hypothetical protein CW751_13025 [Brumimicrobium salinarum]